MARPRLTTFPSSRFCCAALLAVVLAGCDSSADQASASHEIAPALLEHGNRQVRKMLTARPAMATWPSGGAVTEQDIVWQWVALRFAGLEAGEPVFWDIGAPGGDVHAEHQYPTPMQSGYIRIRDLQTHGDGSHQALFEELWHSAIFELINMRGGPEFYRAFLTAIEVGMPLEEWVKRNMSLEIGALVDTVAFYKEVWLPMARDKGFTPDTETWRLTTPTNYEEWVECSPPRSDPLRATWKQFYDDVIVPYRKSLEAYDKRTGK